MSPVAPFLIFRLIFLFIICFLNLRVREKVSFKKHAQRFEGDFFKKTRSVLKAPCLKFSKKVLARLSLYNMLSHKNTSLNKNMKNA